MSVRTSSCIIQTFYIYYKLSEPNVTNHVPFDREDRTDMMDSTHSKAATLLNRAVSHADKCKSFHDMRLSQISIFCINILTENYQLFLDNTKFCTNDGSRTYLCKSVIGNSKLK